MVRIVRAYQFAEKEDMAPEEASRELYDENVIPEPTGKPEGEQESND